MLDAGAANRYLALVEIGPTGGTFSRPLFQPASHELTWFATIFLPTVVSLSPDDHVRILPSNSVTGAKGTIILQHQLKGCQRLECSCVREKRRNHKRNR